MFGWEDYNETEILNNNLPGSILKPNRRSVQTSESEEDFLENSFFLNTDEEGFVWEQRKQPEEPPHGQEKFANTLDEQRQNLCFHSQKKTDLPGEPFDPIMPDTAINDLSELVSNPASTFYFRVSSQAMLNDGIALRDILTVDRSRSPENGDLVVAAVENRYILRRLQIIRQQPVLISSCRNCRLIRLNNLDDIWGVVINIIHHL